MEAYEDPDHEWNSSKFHTGKMCIEPGCNKPAGTKWGKYWCQIHNANRFCRINDQFESILKMIDKEE